MAVCVLREIDSIPELLRSILLNLCAVYSEGGWPLKVWLRLELQWCVGGGLTSGGWVSRVTFYDLPVE